MSGLRVILCSLVLVLTFWSGTGAHAAEAAWDASAAHAAIHAQSVGEEDQGDEGSGDAADHHGCHGQCVGMIGGLADQMAESPLSALWEGTQPGSGPAVRPDQQLRPPIA